MGFKTGDRVVITSENSVFGEITDVRDNKCLVQYKDASGQICNKEFDKDSLMGFMREGTREYMMGIDVAKGEDVSINHVRKIGSTNKASKGVYFLGEK